MIICERELTDVTTGQTLLVRIGAPEKVTDDEWRCEVQVVFRSREYVEWSFGLDAYQAVQLSSDAARILISKLVPAAAWKSIPLELAFPRAVPTFLGESFYSDACSMIDAKIESFVARRQ